MVSKDGEKRQLLECSKVCVFISIELWIVAGGRFGMFPPPPLVTNMDQPARVNRPQGEEEVTEKPTEAPKLCKIFTLWEYKVRPRDPYGLVTCQCFCSRTFGDCDKKFQIFQAGRFCTWERACMICMLVVFWYFGIQDTEWAWNSMLHWVAISVAGWW